MKILVACEESQRVCIAFRNKGHEAYSCDIIECSGEHPEWHIKEDAIKVLYGQKWDMVIAHPPCTYLTVAGAANIPKHPERIEKGFEAANFFMEFYNYALKNQCKMCIENPVPMKIFNLPKYTQIIQPYMFGEPYSKRTCLWLFNLEKLTPTKIIDKSEIEFSPIRYYKGIKKRESKWYNSSNSKERSKTFRGIANAMAEQWGAL